MVRKWDPAAFLKTLAVPGMSVRKACDLAGVGHAVVYELRGADTPEGREFKRQWDAALRQRRNGGRSQVDRAIRFARADTAIAAQAGDVTAAHAGSRADEDFAEMIAAAKGGAELAVRALHSHLATFLRGRVVPPPELCEYFADACERIAGTHRPRRKPRDNPWAPRPEIQELAELFRWPRGEKPSVVFNLVPKRGNPKNHPSPDEAHFRAAFYVVEVERIKGELESGRRPYRRKRGSTPLKEAIDVVAKEQWSSDRTIARAHTTFGRLPLQLQRELREIVAFIRSSSPLT